MSNTTETESEKVKSLMEKCTKIQESLKKSSTVKEHLIPADELKDLEKSAAERLLKKFGHVGLFISLVTHGIEIGEGIYKVIKMKHAIDALTKIRDALNKDKATFFDKAEVQKDIDTVDKVLRQAVAYEKKVVKEAKSTGFWFFVGVGVVFLFGYAVHRNRSG